MKRILTIALCVIAMLTLAGAALAENGAAALVSTGMDVLADFERGADPCERICFDESTGADALLTFGEDVKYKFSENGMLISGKSEDVNASSFTVRRIFDFGGEESGNPVIRVSIDAVAKLGAHMNVALYLDDAAEPFVRRQITPQAKKDSWDDEVRLFCELDEPIFGEHYITIAVEDETTTPSKKTSMMLRGIRFYRESLPIVYVNIDESLGTIAAMNGDKVHETRCYGTVKIAVPEGYRGGYGDETYAGGEYRLEYIRGRGESTWGMPKKPYELKLESGADLFGMGKNKNWALIANYFDRSHVRNRLTYALGEMLGMPYTPQLVPVEVVMNGEYLGLYYLSENVRVGEGRVEIDDLEGKAGEDEDITGGYLLATRRPYNEEPEYKFTTERGTRLLISSPDEVSADVPAEKLDEMRKYIIDYVGKMEDALYGDDFRDAEGASYTDYADLDSIVRDYLMQEFSMNSDGFVTDSSYFYKPRGEKLYWGPLWDFDYVAWGGNSWASYKVDEEEAAEDLQGFRFEHDWILRLREDPEFIKAVKAVWGGPDSDDPNTLEYMLNDVIRDGGLLDQYEAELAIAAENNEDIAHGMDDIFADMGDVDFEIIGNDFHSEIWRLKRWIRNRVNWVNANLDSLQITDNIVHLDFYSDGELLESRDVRRYTTIDDLPVPAPQENRWFAGWYGDEVIEDVDTGETTTTNVRVTRGHYLRVGMTLNARWIDAENAILPEALYLPVSDFYDVRDGYLDLTATVMPEGADDALFFSSSDPLIADVDGSGRVHLKAAEGEATITVSTANGVQAQLTVHIVEEDALSKEIFGFSADAAELELKAGAWQKITLTNDPEEAALQEYRILNADPDVAYMTPEGVVAARAAGKTTIFVVHKDVDEAVEIKVTVTED